jgi:hypothetical protein
MGPGKPRERRELDGEDDEMRQIRASLGAGAQNIVTSMVHPGVNPKKYKNLRVSGFFFLLSPSQTVRGRDWTLHEGFILFLGSHIGKEAKV